MTERETLLANIQVLQEENAVLRGQLAHTVTHKKLQEEYESWNRVYRSEVAKNAALQERIDELEIELARHRARDPIAETIT